MRCNGNVQLSFATLSAPQLRMTYQIAACIGHISCAAPVCRLGLLEP